MATIKFGTSGWREIIARNFTFDNVRLATQGIADYLKQLSTFNPQRSTIILGHDTRFLGRHFPSQPPKFSRQTASSRSCVTATRPRPSSQTLSWRMSA
jgi:hypothetical protein